MAKSKGRVQDYAVDFSDMVIIMAADHSKNHGFLLRSITETTYNHMGFGGLLHDFLHNELRTHMGQAGRYHRQIALAIVAPPHPIVLSTNRYSACVRWRGPAQQEILRLVRVWNRSEN